MIEGAVVQGRLKRGHDELFVHMAPPSRSRTSKLSENTLSRLPSFQAAITPFMECVMQNESMC
jgi:hypothetical protein